MSVLLFTITVALTVFSVACSVIYLLINNFFAVSDVENRNKSIKAMMEITMVSAMVTALLTGLLSDSANIEAAMASTVTLYFALAISMLSEILISCAVLIYRFVSKRSYYSGTSAGVSQMVRIAAIGSAVSLILAWLFS